jgi:nitrite reductase/ring-hydroxylating ferredoxin subunit
MSAAVFLCRTSEVAVGAAKKIELDHGAVAIFNIEGSFYVTDDRCTHGLSSLSEGTLDGDVIECSLHYGGFHVPTGEAVLPPCSVALRTYPVDIRGEDIYISLD